MPPIAKITKEMIVNAGFDIARQYGIENVNARTVSEKLGCSTQPVMYHFKKIEDIKKAVYQKADQYHTAYIADIEGDDQMLEMGLSYIRFAQEEKNLFRLLFQSNGFSGKSVTELISADDSIPLLTALSKAADVSLTQAGAIFKLLFLFIHGYASMYANNLLEYDEDIIRVDLQRIFAGAIYESKEDLL